MIKSDKKVNELSQLLSGKNYLVISEGIGFLREEEPFEEAIGLLVSFYDKTENPQVKKTIEGFLNDVKDLNARHEVMTEVRKPFKEETIRMLLASCWQSGLDYSEYSDDFVNIFLRSDYVTALECLTVIEESVHELSKEKRAEFINIIEKDHAKASAEKAGLTRELIAILKQ